MARHKRTVRLNKSPDHTSDAAFTVSVFAFVIVAIILTLLILLEALSDAPPLLATTSVVGLAVFSFAVGRALHSRARSVPKNWEVAPPRLKMKSRRLRRSG